MIVFFQVQIKQIEDCKFFHVTSISQWGSVDAEGPPIRIIVPCFLEYILPLLLSHFILADLNKPIVFLLCNFIDVYCCFFHYIFYRYYKKLIIMGLR